MSQSPPIQLEVALAYAYQTAFLVAVLVTVLGTLLFVLGWLIHGYRPKLLKAIEEPVVTEPVLDVMPKAP